MRHTLAIAGLSMGLAAISHSAPPSAKIHPATKLTAEQIVERNVAARGGLEAWRKIQTMVWLGHIESAHGPMPSMPFVLEQKRPNKTHFEIHTMDRTTERVFNGEQGWKAHSGPDGRPIAEPLSLQDLRFAQTEPGLDGPLIDYALKGYTVSLKGVDMLDGRKAYRLDVRLRTGEIDHVWVDAQTYLDMRYDRPTEGVIAGGRSVSVVYSDYRSFDGVQIPMIIETGAGAGGTPDRMIIERVVMNAPLNDDRFGPPGVQHPHYPARRYPGAVPRPRPPLPPVPQPASP